MEENLSPEGIIWLLPGTRVFQVQLSIGNYTLLKAFGVPAPAGKEKLLIIMAGVPGERILKEMRYKIGRFDLQGVPGGF
ncbi:MAG: hypothetical protein GKC10_05140 [Methanosarcinales archaeon]|nr:hypothetical protein [Methanosarcinales archaeon]